MSEKPQKRLVSKREYVRIAGKGTALNLSGTTLACAGVGGLTFSVLLLFIGVGMWTNWHNAQWDEEMVDMVKGAGFSSAISGVFGIASLYCASRAFAPAKKSEPVAPITKRNAKHLPAVETLVRASDLPSSHQQAELLRGVGDAQQRDPTGGTVESDHEQQGRLTAIPARFPTWEQYAITVLLSVKAMGRSRTHVSETGTKRHGGYGRDRRTMRHFQRAATVPAPARISLYLWARKR